jgi:lipoyl(octanoyl) transferase
MRPLAVRRLGSIGYAEAVDLQRALVEQRRAGDIPDTLLLLEHPHVITLGVKTRNDRSHILASEESLAAEGIAVFETGRGGDVTYHGPGQLVGYPIIDLKRHRKDLHWYLRQVEAALIDAIGEFGIVGGRVAKYTGVWVDPDRDSRRKIASIGVHARDWVTWHGFALNVNTDLRYFDLIVPCGIPDVTMTSVARELQSGSVDMHAVAREVTRAFGRAFSLTPKLSDQNAVTPRGAGMVKAAANEPAH